MAKRLGDTVHFVPNASECFLLMETGHSKWRIFRRYHQSLEILEMLLFVDFDPKIHTSMSTNRRYTIVVVNIIFTSQENVGWSKKWTTRSEGPSCKRYIHPSKPVVSDWELYPLTKVSVTWCLRHWALLWWFLVGAADTGHTSHRWRARYKGVGWREWYPRTLSRKNQECMQKPHWNFQPTVDEDLVYYIWTI